MAKRTKEQRKRLSEAMKKRWAAKRNPPPTPITNEVKTVPQDLAEARENNLRSMWESSLDALVGKRDRLSAQLNDLDKHIRIRQIQLGLV